MAALLLSCPICQAKLLAYISYVNVSHSDLPKNGKLTLISLITLTLITLIVLLTLIMRVDCRSHRPLETRVRYVRSL